MNSISIQERGLKKIDKREDALFQSLSSLTQKRGYADMFDYYKSIVDKLGEDRSFFTTDFADVLWKLQQWREELPLVHMFYAVKANPDSVLLRLLVMLGTSFDCASEGEIRAVMAAGANPDSIIFANPNISPRGLRYAKKIGVELMTFDGEEQLHKVSKIYPEARLLIRICPSEAECTFDFREKFGCQLDDAPNLLQTAKRLGLNVVGISFHVGSLNTLSTAFASSVRAARTVFDCALSLGFSFSILDIGGGFPGSIGTEDVFRETTRSIRESLSTHFPMENVRVFAEPGCYVVASAVTVTTTIYRKKTIKNRTDENDSNLKQCYFLNNSIYYSFLPANEVYGVFYEPLLSQKELLERKFYRSNLFGQTLCSTDVIRRDVVFPNMRVGESLVWKNVGAYSLPLHTSFCGFEKPVSRYVFRKDSRLHTDWIKNLDGISKYLSNIVHVISE